MNRCPITYQECKEQFSRKGLSKLSAHLKSLNPLTLNAKEQRLEAAKRAGKMSIQGVQPKLSAILSLKHHAFEIVDAKGKYIIKPQSDLYSEMPENEDLTMKMASVFGIEVPLTGLVYSKDGSLSYFIKRFDRYGKNKKLSLEDFAQLTNNTRDTKYNWSMEKLIPILDSHCTFPMIEKRKLFRRTLFCFLTGNEDMHLKNFSLISRDNKVELSPAYDLLNTTIAMGGANEELALPLTGKKKSFTKKHFFEYFAIQRLGLNEKIVKGELDNIIRTKPQMDSLIEISFLSDEMKLNYHELLDERFIRITE